MLQMTLSLDGLRTQFELTNDIRLIDGSVVVLGAADRNALTSTQAINVRNNFDGSIREVRKNEYCLKKKL